MICDWTDKRKYFVHYRMSNFYIRHGMVVGEVHEIISFKQSKWLENYINFDTQNRNHPVNDFERTSIK